MDRRSAGHRGRAGGGLGDHGRPALSGGTASYVAEATRADGSPAVLKVIFPRDVPSARNEITVLRLAAGDGCARLLRADEDRNALLLERLGGTLASSGLSVAAKQEILCAAAQRVWRPVPPGTGLLCTQIGLQPQGRLLLAAAEVLAG